LTEEKTRPGQKDALISFTTFVLSLSTAALQNLGVSISEDGKDEQACVNLAMAKQTIDVLEMLEEKTSGNLTEQEKKLLENVLYDLRMRYVKAASEANCSET